MRVMDIWDIGLDFRNGVEGERIERLGKFVFIVLWEKSILGVNIIKCYIKLYF